MKKSSFVMFLVAVLMFAGMYQDASAHGRKHYRGRAYRYAPPPVYRPAPVLYYGRPPVVHPRYRRVWVPGHWSHPYHRSGWVPGHWSRQRC